MAGAAVAGVFAGKYLEKKENEAEPMDLGDHVLAVDGPANFNHEADMYKMKYLSNKWPEVRPRSNPHFPTDPKPILSPPDRPVPCDRRYRSRSALINPRAHTSRLIQTGPPRGCQDPRRLGPAPPVPLSCLTGKHPFNVEAPPVEIFDYGFISPVNLHIVRNHGAVPKLDWDTHRIEISGNVPKPYSIGMDELTEDAVRCFRASWCARVTAARSRT